nr:putative capsid [Marmot picobirnavirus]
MSYQRKESDYYMTSNQNAANRNREDARHNAESEKETARSNRANEHNARMRNLVQFITGSGANLVKRAALPGFNASWWYNQSLAQFKDATRLPFIAKRGEFFEWVENAVTAGPKSPRLSDCNLMVLQYTPTIGMLGYDGDLLTSDVPADTIATQLFNKLRSISNSRLDFEPTDLVQFVVAFDSVVLAIAFCRMILRLTKNVDPMGTFDPMKTIRSFGINAQDVADNATRYSDILNNIVAQLVPIKVPAIFPLIVRHAWMSSCIFKDEDSVKGQRYAFCPQYIWKWVEGASVSTATLELQPFAGKLLNEANDWGLGMNYEDSNLTVTSSFPRLLSTIRECVRALVESEDVITMSSQIVKAFGESGTYQIDMVNYDDLGPVEMVYNPEVLNQIQNATVLGDLDPTATITQEGLRLKANNFLFTKHVSDAMFTYTGEGTGHPEIGLTCCSNRSPIFNMYKDVPTADDIMVSSRLIVPYALGKKNGTVTPLSCGSEIINSIVIFYNYGGYKNAKTNTVYRGVKLFDQTYVTLSKGGYDTYSYPLMRFLLEQFDWKPQITFLADFTLRTVSKSEVITAGVYLLGREVNNIINVSETDMYLLHNAALTSELGIGWDVMDKAGVQSDKVGSSRRSRKK